MATSINQVVSSETSIGGGIYAPPKRASTAAEDNAPSTASVPLARRRAAQPEIEVFLIAVREPYRSTLSKLMVLIAPFQEQLAKAAFKVQLETSTYNKRRDQKPFSLPSFFGKGLLRSLVR